MPITGTGVEELLVPPLPNLPSAPAPQQTTEPDARTAQAWVSPALTTTASVKVDTATGVRLPDVVPLPS